MSLQFRKFSVQIHLNLSGLFKDRKGDILTTAEIRRIYEKKYINPDVMWVHPPDHCINRVNKVACWCAETDEAIFERIKHGEYKVRDFQIWSMPPQV